MLFGKKVTDDKLRLIGGFADVKDNGFEETAIREFKEETGGDLINVEYITSQLSNDWRFRESGDKIIKMYLELFHNKETIFFALSGLIVLTPFVDLGNFIVPYIFNMENNHGKYTMGYQSVILNLLSGRCSSCKSKL